MRSPRQLRALANPSPPTKKRPRDPSDFARIYHSKERRAFVSAYGCLMSQDLPGLELEWMDCVGPIDNAHTESGKGTGYKAGYETIAPLCRHHHQQFDRRLAPFSGEASRQAIKDFAPRIEVMWQEYCAQTGADVPDSPTHR